MCTSAAESAVQKQNILYTLQSIDYKTHSLPANNKQVQEPTSRLSSCAKNQDDCANRKSPTRTATLVPNFLLTVGAPGCQKIRYQIAFQKGGDQQKYA